MILVVLVAVVLATFVPLMRGAARGSAAARVAGALEAVLFVVGTSVAGLAALAFLALKCDESCDDNIAPEVRSGHWWRTLDAWQWNVQAGLALAAFLAAFATLVLVAARSYRAATVTVVAGLAAFCSWALLMAPLGEQFGI